MTETITHLLEKNTYHRLVAKAVNQCQWKQLRPRTTRIIIEFEEWHGDRQETNRRQFEFTSVRCELLIKMAIKMIYIYI